MLRLSPNPMVVDELDHDDKKTAAVVRLEEEISKMKWANGSAEIKLLNGQYLLVINAIPNRRRGEATDLNQLIDYVVSDFEDAYGIVYEFDEQTATTYGRGVFSVRVIKRGKCDIVLDPFLSLTIPVVEDLDFGN